MVAGVQNGQRAMGVLLQAGGGRFPQRPPPIYFLEGPTVIG
jgi:hypothetical protein